MDQVQTAKVENVENVFQGSGVASVFDGSGVASVFESGGSRDSSMVDFANPSASLMSEKLEQPWVESNGMEDDHNAPTDSAVGSEASKKLQLSLDELIEQQQGSHRQQQQSDYNNFRGRRRGQGVRPPYHHPHPYHHHPAIPPPPPISYGPMFSCPMNGPLGRPNGIGSLSIGSGFHRGEGQFPISAELLSRQSLRTASTLRRARLLRSQPYELMAGGRQQIVAELLLQQQRTRKALFLAGVNPDVQLVAPVPPLARSIRPRRKVEDPVVLAEQSALNDSELIYPVMIESSDGTTQVESSDDALIIEFKGTQVLKVRKSRGEMVRLKYFCCPLFLLSN